MNDLHRGYIAEGKDRQHPVTDPDAFAIPALQPQAPVLGGIKTWYAIAGVSTTPPVPGDGA